VTFGDLTSDLYRRFGYASSPDSGVVTRFKAYLNETQREIFGTPGLERLLFGTTTFASVADTPDYALPPNVARVLAIYEATNRRRLLSLDRSTYRTIEPDPTTQTGTPTHAVDLGIGFVARQPSAADELFIDSTSASDTGVAFLEGYRTGGYPFALQVTMTGTTAVAFPTHSDIVEITDFYLDAAAVGTVTLHEGASGGTELARIPIGYRRSRYRKVALWPTPAAAITYSLDYERDVTDLVNDDDEPELPYRFHHLLGIGARAKEYEKKDDTRYRDAVLQFRKGLDDLKYFVASQSDGGLVMGRRTVQRPSQLGGWFEAGT
jgi:hypothetical protein